MIRETLRSSFWQLIVIYSLMVAMIAFGFFQKYAIQFHIFAIVLAGIGISILPSEINIHKGKKIHLIILGIALLLVVVFRVFLYLNNQIPSGYDAGLYKYGIEHGLENRDLWILEGGMEPGFLYLMEFFKLFLSTDVILKWVLIFFCMVLGLGIYLFTVELAGREAGVFSTIVYAFSVVQFKSFWFMYYKNIIGLVVMMFALYSLKRHEVEKRKGFLYAFIALGGFLLAIHRPTFYIFGLSYFVFAFVSPYREKKYEWKKLKSNVMSGVLILLIGMFFYVGDFLPAITKILPWVVHGFSSPGESPGTFISFFEYQYSTLFYLPLGFIGLFYYVKRKEFNFVAIWAIINLVIVYFQFFFFNRFLIHLDLALIIFSGVGFAILKQEKKNSKFVIGIIVILLSAGFLFSLKEARDSEPLISIESLDLIKSIPMNTEENAKIMSISSEYSPWLKGYSNRVVIAPGLFDEDKWSEEQWIKFWSVESEEEMKILMRDYEEPIYLFTGSKSFNNPCFSLYMEEKGGKIYEYGC